MSESILFSTWLNDIMTVQKISADHLQHELGYQRGTHIRSWLDGQSRPMLFELPALATVLRVDPVSLICGWVADQLPEMETILRVEVLEPRGSTFPRSTDLTLRAPKPQKPVQLW